MNIKTKSKKFPLKSDFRKCYRRAMKRVPHGPMDVPCDSASELLLLHVVDSRDPPDRKSACYPAPSGRVCSQPCRRSALTVCGGPGRVASPASEASGEGRPREPGRAGQGGGPGPGGGSRLRRRGGRGAETWGSDDGWPRTGRAVWPAARPHRRPPSVALPLRPRSSWPPPATPVLARRQRRPCEAQVTWRQVVTGARPSP